MQPRPSAQRTIPVRRLDVDLGEATLERWLVADDPILSHFTATLSAVFPRGEEFFVHTVRQHRDVAKGDPLLARQVKAFAGQEAMHGREHRALNAHLDGLGYHTHRAERDIGRILDVIVKLRPSTLPLAVTAGSEHLTGILAEAVLDHEPTRRVLFNDADIQTLITWHALEELEHKNVAFDVLERAGGGYAVRIAGLGIAVGALGGYVVVAWARSVAADRRHIGRRQLRRFAIDLRRQRLLSPWAARQVIRYLRPGFHPDDLPSDHLVHEWKDRLADRTTITAGASRSA